GGPPQQGGDVHDPSSESSTTTSTCPVSTWSPAATRTSVSVPSTGAVTVCSIFIASSTTSGCPAVTAAPAAASTRTTPPGMGASSDPAWATALGSANRGTSRSAEEPSGPSTYATPA